jgi:hypothetical protein
MSISPGSAKPQERSWEDHLRSPFPGAWASKSGFEIECWTESGTLRNGDHLSNLLCSHQSARVARPPRMTLTVQGWSTCLICEALFSAGLGEPHCWLEVENVPENERAEDGFQGFLRKDSFNRQPLSRSRDPRDRCLRQHLLQRPTQKLAFFQLFSLKQPSLLPSGIFP